MPQALVEVLWRRRWVVGLTMGVCVLAGAIYLACAPRVYRATATVLVNFSAPKALNEGFASGVDSDNYLQTQAEVMRSSRVLTRAIGEAESSAVRTLGEATDALGWLKRGGAFQVDVPRKRSDTLVVSMDSRWPDEAAALVNAVIRAYIVERGEQQRATGADMVKRLETEKAGLARRREECAAAMVRMKRDNGVLSFRDEPSNSSMDSALTLSRAVIAAELAVIELRGQEKAVERAISDPKALEAYVAAQQLRGREFIDPQFEELQRQAITAGILAATQRTTLGPMHPRLQVLGWVDAELRSRINVRTREIAAAHLASVRAQRVAAEERLTELRAAHHEREGRALALTPAAAEYAKQESEAERLQRQIELLDRRLTEVSVNSAAGTPLDVRVLEPAQVEAKPIKPSNPMTLAVALLTGCMAGAGLAIIRDRRDVRLRTPHDVRVALATPVVAMVPRIDPRLSPVVRGRLVQLDPRSPAAEAYRSIRTALRLGVAHDAKTILIASPAEGDGKSTTASNLAVAFALAGERTLLIDCDLREPVQHLIFGLDSPAGDGAGELSGLTGILTDRASIADAICPTDVPGLHILPCGALPINPSELLAGKPFALLVQTLAAAFDRLIFDSPPLTHFSDGRVLAASADATVVVVRMNQSARHLGLLALDGLNRVGANVVGAVANDVTSPSSQYRRYGGAWEYAARDTRVLPTRSIMVAAHSSAGQNGNGNGNGNSVSHSSDPAKRTVDMGPFSDRNMDQSGED